MTRCIFLLRLYFNNKYINDINWTFPKSIFRFLIGCLVTSVCFCFNFLPACQSGVFQRAPFFRLLHYVSVIGSLGLLVTFVFGWTHTITTRRQMAMRKSVKEARMPEVRTEIKPYVFLFSYIFAILLQNIFCQIW